MKIVKIYALFSTEYPESIKYVGKTKQTIKRRVSWHINAAKKNKEGWVYNWIRQVLNRGENIESIELESINCEIGTEWVEREIYWISEMKHRGHNLTNCTDGGDGSLGYKQPRELVEKRAEKIRGIARPEEVKKKISESNKGKQKTEEHCKNISKKITELQGKPVYQYDLEGNFIKEWESGASAAKFYNVDRTSLYRCCQGKFKKSAGFVWKYKKDVLNEDIV